MLHEKVMWVLLSGECTTIDGRLAFMSGFVLTVIVFDNDANSFAKVSTSEDFLLSSKAISSSTGCLSDSKWLFN